MWPRLGILSNKCCFFQGGKFPLPSGTWEDSSSSSMTETRVWVKAAEASLASATPTALQSSKGSGLTPPLEFSWSLGEQCTQGTGCGGRACLGAVREDRTSRAEGQDLMRKT